MLVSSYSARIVSPFQQGPQDASHATLEIAWVTRGRIGATVGGEYQLLDPERVAVVSPRVVHSSGTLDEEVAAHVLHVVAPQLSRVIATGLYALDARAYALLRAFPAPTAPRIDVERAARELLAQLETLATPSGDPTDPRLRRIVRLLADDPTAPLTLDELARRAHMSRHHFAREFRRVLGVSPMAYVRQLRVERAALLLRSTDHSVARVALESGFSSAGRLSDAFRAHFGLGPSSWRERQRAEHIRQSSG